MIRPLSRHGAACRAGNLPLLFCYQLIKATISRPVIAIVQRLGTTAGELPFARSAAIKGPVRLTAESRTGYVSLGNRRAPHPFTLGPRPQTRPSRHNGGNCTLCATRLLSPEFAKPQRQSACRIAGISNPSGFNRTIVLWMEGQSNDA